MGEARLISVMLKFWLHKKNKFKISKVHLIDQFKVNYLPQGPYLNDVASKRGRGLKISQNWLRHSSKNGYVRGRGVKILKKMATWFV